MPNLKNLIYFTIKVDNVILRIYKWMLDFILTRWKINVCLFLSLMVIANFILFFMYYIRAWNMNAFFQQIVVQLIMLCGLTNFLQLSFAQKDIAAFIHSLGLRESLEDRMKTCKFLRNDLLMTMPMMITVCQLLTPVSGGYHLHFFLIYLDEYDVPYSSVIKWAYLFIFNFCYITVILYYFVCLCFHADLVVRCKRLEQDIINLSEVDVKTPLYQEHVRETLKQCITQHIFLKRTVKNMKIVRALMFVYSLAGMCLGGNIIAYIFLDIAREEKVRLAIMFVCTIFFVYKMVSLGQEVQDASEKIYVAATNTPWYQWNKGNSVLLQILLIQSIRPLYLSNGINTIDNLFLIKIFKGMYTMGMFYHTSLQRRV